MVPDSGRHSLYIKGTDNTELCPWLVIPPTWNNHDGMTKSHSMMTSSNVPFSALLAFCVGNSPVTGEFPAQRPVTRSFDIFLICAWINCWVNNREASDLRRHRAHYEVSVMRNASVNPARGVGVGVGVGGLALFICFVSTLWLLINHRKVCDNICTHWKSRLETPTSSSLVAPEVVVVTNPGTAVTTKLTSWLL